MTPICTACQFACRTISEDEHSRGVCLGCRSGDWSDTTIQQFDAGTIRDNSDRNWVRVLLAICVLTTLVILHEAVKS